MGLVAIPHYFNLEKHHVYFCIPYRFSIKFLTRLLTLKARASCKTALEESSYAG